MEWIIFVYLCIVNIYYSTALMLQIRELCEIIISIWKAKLKFVFTLNWLYVILSI